MEVPQITRQNNPMIQQFHDGNITQRHGYQCVKEISALPHLLLHHSQQPREGRRRCPLEMDKTNVIHVHNGISLGHENGGKLQVICNNMHEPGGYSVP